MPKYRYKFCDGTVNEIEVTDKQYALLTAMDKQERMNNRRQGRRTVPLEGHICREEKPDFKRDRDYNGDNE